MILSSAIDAWTVLPAVQALSLPWPASDVWALTQQFLTVAASDPLSAILIAAGGVLTLGTVAVAGVLVVGAAAEVLLPGLGLGGGSTGEP